MGGGGSCSLNSRLQHIQIRLRRARTWRPHRPAPCPQALPRSHGGPVGAPLGWRGALPRSRHGSPPGSPKGCSAPSSTRGVFPAPRFPPLQAAAGPGRAVHPRPGEPQQEGSAALPSPEAAEGSALSCPAQLGPHRGRGFPVPLCRGQQSPHTAQPGLGTPPDLPDTPSPPTPTSPGFCSPQKN